MDIDEFYRVIGNDLATKFGRKFQVNGPRAPTTSTLFNNNPVFSHEWTILFYTDHPSYMALICSPNDAYSQFWETFSLVIRERECNDNITPLMQQYLAEIGINMDDETQPDVFQGESDWHLMCGFYAEEHTIYWLVNINPTSVLFEYVLIYGENYADASPNDAEYDLMHLSKFDARKHLISIYENYSGCNNKDVDEDNTVVLK